MNRLTVVKFVLAGAGILVWGYGARLDVESVRLAGIIVVGIAFALRFLPRRVRDRIDGRAPDAPSADR